MPDYSIKVDVPLVNVDVLVTTKDGQFIPGLKKDNFRVMEDGVEQSVTNFDDFAKRRSPRCCWSSLPPRTTTSWWTR